MRYIVLDTETTGLDPKEGHRIIEIAALELKERKLTRDYRHYFINPERQSDEAALRIHGLTEEFLLDKPKFSAIAQEFLQYIEGATLIIHNAPFDMAFLNSEINRLKLGKMEDYVVEVIDTLAMAKELFPGKRNNLDALCDRFEVNRSARVLHGALIDCELLAEVYFSMTRGQNSLLMEHEEDQQHVIHPLQMGQQTGARARHFIVHCASEAELAAHAAYLDLLDKAATEGCLWKKLDQSEIV
jgi:DNA polymerase-3 subunit epsilon